MKRHNQTPPPFFILAYPSTAGSVSAIILRFTSCHAFANPKHEHPPVKIRSYAIVLALCLSAPPLHAEWREEAGFTRLQSIAGADLPTSLAKGFAQIEAFPSGTTNYSPNTLDPRFTGKNFILKSGASPSSSDHATHVATNFYSTSSLLPSPAPVTVDLYSAGNWLGSAFLKLGTSSPPAIESRAVENHSWIGTGWVPADVEEADQRLDFAIDRDGFVCVVGENNGTSSILPSVLGQSYHTISVGRSDGQHSAGFTTADVAGRVKPDIVAPSASPENATSWTTPMVGSAAGLLYAKLSASPYSLSGADLPRVIKALLLASARKDTVPSWANSATRPLDLRYGAGVMNIHHAYLALRAGRAGSGSTQYGIRGWAAESVGGTARTYYLTVPAGAPSTPFCAALTWHRVISDGSNGPFSWSPSAAPPADLSLHLFHATGTTLGSEITASDSAVDNVELVYQATLAPGDYALQIQNATGTSTPYGLAWHSLPSVSIASTNPTAKEIDGQQGLITLTRAGDTTLALQVPLSVGGTAVPGSHYQTLPATVTIPAGQASASLPLIPVSDDIAQGNRSVIVSVAADFTLVRDPAQPATITIDDKPYDSWRLMAFTTAELADPSVSGPTSDPDADQLQNLVEYALGLSPKSANVSPVALIDSSGYLALSTAKNPTATDIIWSAQAGPDLDSWPAATILTNTSTTFTARDTILKSSAVRRFIRIGIERK